MDTDRSLHLYADGEDQGVVAPHIPDPCYFMFDLFDYCTKVFFLLAIGVTVCDAGGVCSCFSLTFTICKFAQALLHRHIMLIFYKQIVVCVLFGVMQHLYNFRSETHTHKNKKQPNPTNNSKNSNNTKAVQTPAEDFVSRVVSYVDLREERKNSLLVTL